jgi:hypothetical protein
MTTYAEKLRDPRWQQKRLKIMERDGFRCLECGGDKDTLNVHHGCYVPGRDPWDYDDDLLHTLCERCHERTQAVLAHVHELLGSLRIHELRAAVNALVATGVCRLEPVPCQIAKPRKRSTAEVIAEMEARIERLARFSSPDDEELATSRLALAQMRELEKYELEHSNGG